ncbi:MAG: cytochrome C, partial [candidate division NC10 bacterium]
DPRSKISAANIVATCRQCHPAATWKFTEFQPHADHTNKERFPRLYYSWLLMTALLIGTFSFFGIHTLLWLPRSLVERLRRGRADGGAEPEP